jgi:thiol:disulfide interchange protein DsbD
MKIRSHIILLVLLVCAIFACPSAVAQIQPVGDGGPGPVKAQHLTVEMVSLASSIAPGGTLEAGLVITLEEKWHVYWINAGDSGEPPKIRWTLPRGITAGPMRFPIPTRLPLGPLMDFGYEDEVAFPVLLTAAKGTKPGPIHLDAQVDWLVCREVCIPGKAHLGLNLTVDPKATATPQPVGALGEALGLLPKPLTPDMKATVKGGQKELVLDLEMGALADDAEFYPFDQEQIANAGDQDVDPLPNGVRIRIPRAPELTKLPVTLRGVVKLDEEHAYEVNAPVVAGEVPRPAGATAPGGSAQMTTVAAISLAFVGGLILNLMPCVFPVLFLKGLSLVQSSNEERGRIRRHGLVYTLGILFSFWAIVAALLIVRAGGSEAGWGFQLQSPTFLTILASGIFLFALSLAGLFDIGLSLTSVGGELAQKQGYAGSFFTGVLATVVATPCTAPFMGAAIGFAISQPGWVTFAVFTALALGLAAPYLLLSLQPSWTRLLPKPGAWMEVFKQITAVIFFATVIWLTYVYGSLYSAGGQGVYRASLLLTCFLLLAVAGWVLGRWPARWSSSIAALLIGVIALAVPLYQPKDTTLTWQPYSQQALEQARAAGHPVFIDFTAAWCLSCQVNERVVLKSSDVQKEFRDKNVTLLRADWTQYDAEITKELASVGRSGVPTYVIYPVGNKPGDVLPELLTKDVVLSALKRDTQ